MTLEHPVCVFLLFAFAIFLIAKCFYDRYKYLSLIKEIQEAKEFVNHVSEVSSKFRQETADYARHHEHIQKLKYASDCWSACLLICAEDPFSTREDIVKARQAAKAVVAICHEGQQAGYTDIDYEQIMGRNLNKLNELKNRRGDS